MDEPYLMRAARYVERNPLRAGLVARAEDWPWSSAAAHCGPAPDPLAESEWLRQRIGGWICDWRQFLAYEAGAGPDDEGDIGPRVRRHETTGRPLGDKTFLQRIGEQLGRNLLPSKGGRPRKRKEN
jgi:putative transposase